MKDIFEEPPMVAFRRPANLREKLIKAKLPPTEKQKRIVKGMKKCDKSSPPAPLFRSKKLSNAQRLESRLTLMPPAPGKTTNVVYMISCTKCGVCYI